MNCEEAINYYVSVFKNAKIVSIKRYPDGMGGPMEGMGGKILTAVFELNGQRFVALDGGPIFKFNEAVSFMIDCADQAEADYFTEKLSAHPENEQCGWVKDRFGVSWQIVPRRMAELLNDPDQEKANRALQAMLQMKRIDIAALERAFNGQ